MKKGFTLIELLAVIIILAIVALISTPIILNVVDEARESANKSSVAMYADAVKLAVIDNYFENQSYPAVDITWVNNNVEYGGERIVCQEAYYTDTEGVTLHHCTIGEAAFNYVDDIKVSAEDTVYCYTKGMVYTDCEDVTYKASYDVAKENSVKTSFTLSEAILRDNTVQTVVSDTMFEKVAVSQEKYDTLTESTYPKLSQAVANENGLWKENRDGKTEGNLPTYFFRGNVQNNYVSYAGKMWRIVRINEDNTVKLILGGNTDRDGYIDVSTYYTYYNDDVKYYDYSSSSLKSKIDEWYNSNVNQEDANKIAITKFCNDMSISYENSGNKYYGAYDRLYDNKSPQFMCPNSSDNFEYNIGTLTADEVAYAGGVYNLSNNDYYLYQNAQIYNYSGDWWTLSPGYFYKYRSEANQMIIYGDHIPQGKIFMDGLSISKKARVVISIKSNIIVSGIGTHEEPYIIQ